MITKALKVFLFLSIALFPMLIAGCGQEQGGDNCGALVGGGGIPTIEFTHVPPYGSRDNLQGSVEHVAPEDYKVVVYIKVSGSWWIKPYYNDPKTDINCDGSWTTDVTTGGIDELATEIVAYLIHSDYDPPLSYNSEELNQHAVAMTSAVR